MEPHLEPEEGAWNEGAVDHYPRGGASPEKPRHRAVVTLHHFTNPLWLAKDGGWLDARTPERFARYVERVAAALKDDVRWWVTINEPTVYAKTPW
jgi:beta-glucosidase